MIEKKDFLKKNNGIFYHGNSLNSKFKKFPPSYEKPFFITNSIQYARIFSLMEASSRNGTYNPFDITFNDKLNNYSNIIEIKPKESFNELNLFDFTDDLQKEKIFDGFFGNGFHSFFKVKNSLSFGWLLCLQGQTLLRLNNSISNIRSYFKDIDNRVYNAFFQAIQIYKKQSLTKKDISQYYISNQDVINIINQNNLEKTEDNIQFLRHAIIFLRMAGGIESYEQQIELLDTYEKIIELLKKAIDITNHNFHFFIDNNISDINQANIALNKLLFNKGFHGYISKNTHEYEIAIFKEDFFDTVEISEVKIKNFN